MGDQQISPLSSEAKGEFLRRILDDINALERMIENELIESGVIRIGAEQEFCLIGPDLRPAMTGPDILQSVNESHFTSELAKWNLEINLDPQNVGDGCLKRMDQQLQQMLQLANEKAQAAGCSVILAGILPTIRKSDLEFANMTPKPRYRVLADILKELRGENFALHLEGVDEIELTHDSILFEACNTSFQVHLQIEPSEFVDRYNWAQVLAGPVLAASVNSPMLLGKELWSETRIGLFRQSLEVRNAGNYIRDKQPRVAFGTDWLKSSVAGIYKDDVTYYKLIVSGEMDDEGSTELLRQGKTPELRAMNLHNGTLYKWNRACYGVGNGVPHLRIENRYLPSGPTPHDQMANAAFWIGLMHAMPTKCIGAWDQYFYFQEVRANFLKAARNGLSNELRWFGKFIEADRLILDQLLPLAERGLDSLGVSKGEFEPYLNTIEQRVAQKRTGSRWMIDAMRSLRRKHTIDESTLIITDYLRGNCLDNVPVHEWKIPKGTALKSIPNRYDRVDSIMVTNMVTVREDDLLDFAETLMKWNSFYHLPVENSRGEISGLITAKDVESFRESNPDTSGTLVNACMSTDVFTVTPEASLDEAEKVMLSNGYGSVPVIDEKKRVVGIVTANDLRRLQEKRRNE